jgi:hypothetical protein
MSTLTKGLPAEVKGETSAAPARETARPDYVMLPIARKWGERRVVSPQVIGFVYLFTGVSVFLVTALVR